MLNGLLLSVALTSEALDFLDAVGADVVHAVLAVGLVCEHVGDIGFERVGAIITRRLLEY